MIKRYYRKGSDVSNLTKGLIKELNINAYLESRKSNSNVWFVDFHRNRLRQLTHRLDIAVKSI